MSSECNRCWSSWVKRWTIGEFIDICIFVQNSYVLTAPLLMNLGCSRVSTNKQIPHFVSLGVGFNSTELHSERPRLHIYQSSEQLLETIGRLIEK